MDGTNNNRGWLTWTNVVADGSNLSLEPHFEHFVGLIEKRKKNFIYFT